jgi:hypothetical protein
VYGSEVIVIPIVFGMPTLVILVKMWLGYRERQAMRQQTMMPNAEEILARLERIEQSVEAVAVEMERIGEGQRFTTKLLAERAERVASPMPETAIRRPPERVVTPH